MSEQMNGAHVAPQLHTMLTEQTGRRLYDNLRSELPDPNAFAVDRIVRNIQMYVDAFNLKDSLPLLAE